jgi:hypothetical protein
VQYCCKARKLAADRFGWLFVFLVYLPGTRLVLGALLLEAVGLALALVSQLITVRSLTVFLFLIRLVNPNNSLAETKLSPRRDIRWGICHGQET